eukprot:SAG25_NODE_967_length_4515_cov_7.439312_1_plen_317_part_00
MGNLCGKEVNDQDKHISELQNSHDDGHGVDAGKMQKGKSDPKRRDKGKKKGKRDDVVVTHVNPLEQDEEDDEVIDTELIAGVASQGRFTKAKVDAVVVVDQGAAADESDGNQATVEDKQRSRKGRKDALKKGRKGTKSSKMTELEEQEQDGTDESEEEEEEDSEEDYWDSESESEEEEQPTKRKKGKKKKKKKKKKKSGTPKGSSRDRKMSMLKERHAGDMSAIASTEMASMSMREEQQNRSAMSRRADDKAGAISNKIASKVRYSQRATVDIEVLKAVYCTVTRAICALEIRRSTPNAGMLPSTVPQRPSRERLM